jgi:hypothetical protein
MKTTITRMVKGYSNSALVIPYVYAVLACGHAAKVELIPYTYRCIKCDREHFSSPNKGFQCECGGGIGAIVFTPDPHNDAHIVTKIGDVIECGSCDNQQQAVSILRQAIADRSLHHTRAKSWCGSNQIHAYKLDPTSPSNFFLVVSVEDTPEVQAMLKGTLAPLSPTERA